MLPGNCTLVASDFLMDRNGVSVCVGVQRGEGEGGRGGEEEEYAQGTSEAGVSPNSENIAGEMQNSNTVSWLRCGWRKMRSH